jgi:predicted PP-loop superfamily ATPase
MMPSLEELGIRAGDKGMSLLDLKGLKKEARLAQPESSRAVTVAASGGVDSSVTLAIFAQMVRPSQHERDSSPPHRLSSSPSQIH